MKLSHLLLIFPLLAVAQPLPPGVTQIARGVWFMEDPMCNVEFIEMKDYLIVVDAGFPDVARKAVADAKLLSSKPVKLVFDTHHHGDHLYGNPIWTEAGANTMAHQGVFDEIAKYEPTEFQFTATKFPDVASLNKTAPDLPQKSFSGPLMVMEDATRCVEFRYYGWGHTRGDGFVYLPNEKIICTGDAIVNGPYNFTADADIANWPKVIEQVQKLDIERVLPAHGPAAGKDLLAGQILYLTEVYRQVGDAIKKGMKLTDIITLTDGKPTSTIIKMPDSVSVWVATPRIYGNIRDSYNEITAGKPAGSLPHNGPGPRPKP
jgi:glyoxylase-like metal-dependent hydrolase (beta-lactamase superfamily II)